MQTSRLIEINLAIGEINQPSAQTGMDHIKIGSICRKLPLNKKDCLCFVNRLGILLRPKKNEEARPKKTEEAKERCHRVIFTATP